MGKVAGEREEAQIWMFLFFSSQYLFIAEAPQTLHKKTNNYVSHDFKLYLKWHKLKVITPQRALSPHANVLLVMQERSRRIVNQCL